MTRLERYASWWSSRLNRWNQQVVGVLMLLLLLDVWIGVIDRYLLHWQINWVEEVARYIMIWAILLAVPCCTYGREHIGLELAVKWLPAGLQRILFHVTDILVIAFFGYIAFLGHEFVAKGVQQLSSVFGMPMAVPYAAIPVAFGLAALQGLLVFIRDLRASAVAAHTEEELGVW